MWELGQFEDLLQAVPAQSHPPAKSALYFSMVSDVWVDVDHTELGEAKKNLYLAIKHATHSGPPARTSRYTIILCPCTIAGPAVSF